MSQPHPVHADPIAQYRATAAAKHAAWTAAQSTDPAASTTQTTNCIASTTTTMTNGAARTLPVCDVAGVGGGGGVAEERYIYVLLCSGGRYYVGETSNVQERFVQHVAARHSATTVASSGGIDGAAAAAKGSALPGAAWTRKHEPIEVVRSFVKRSVHDEDNTTLDYMAEHGIRNVRGGSFCMVKLPRHIRRTIKQRLATIKRLCYRCKQPGHCANACPVAAAAAASGVSHSRSWIDCDSEEDNPDRARTATSDPTLIPATSTANPQDGISSLTGNTPAAFTNTPMPTSVVAAAAAIVAASFKTSGFNGGPEHGLRSQATSSSSGPTQAGLFAFDAGPLQDDRDRAPLPESEPERLIDCWPTEPSVPRRPSVQPPPPLRLLSSAILTGSRPPALVCTRCGRNNHSELQCFAKHHLHGHLLPSK
jgi:hypothetical protein